MNSFLRRLAPAAALLLFALLPMAGFAQDRGLEVDIVGGNAAALPIAVVPMPYQGSGAPPPTDVAQVIRADLDRSGQFRTLPDRDMVEHPTRSAEVSYPTWRLLKQDFLVVGRVLDAGGGNYRIEYELFDVAKQQRLAGFAMPPAGPSDLRDIAHQMADAIYEKILGVRGAFWTRIAYVTATGLGAHMQYALMVADSDGYNPHAVVHSAAPLLSPAWSPDGRKLAYVSFERGNSSIFIQDISSSKRELVASFRGINSGPAFSPDGRQLALTLSKSGNPEIYVMDLGSKALRQVTNQLGIDTAAVFSPDGASLYFMSDRGGKPQIYRTSASGGGATRVTFQGSYNADPTISYDGKQIAMAQGNGNNYRIALLDMSLGSPRWSMLSPGSLDESPSFAPNASMILYAAREGSRGVLYAVSADARVRQRLVLADGDVREPAWGPYREQR